MFDYRPLVFSMPFVNGGVVALPASLSLIISPSTISSPSIMCATLTFGPLNHFRAETNHQMRMNSIGPPYTRAVQFISSTLGACEPRYLSRNDEELTLIPPVL